MARGLPWPRMRLWLAGCLTVHGEKPQRAMCNLRPALPAGEKSGGDQQFRFVRGGCSWLEPQHFWLVLGGAGIRGSVTGTNRLHRRKHAARQHNHLQLVYVGDRFEKVFICRSRCRSRTGRRFSRNLEAPADWHANNFPTPPTAFDWRDCEGGADSLARRVSICGRLYTPFLPCTVNRVADTRLKGSVFFRERPRQAFGRGCDVGTFNDGTVPCGYTAKLYSSGGGVASMVRPAPSITKVNPLGNRETGDASEHVASCPPQRGG